MRHGTSAWLCLFFLISGIHPASASAQIVNPMTADEIDALAGATDALQPCIGEYMRSRPLDDSTGKAVIGPGLADELKARTLAVQPGLEFDGLKMQQEIDQAALARDSADASTGDRLAGYMGVLVGAERSPQLPLAKPLPRSGPERLPSGTRDLRPLQAWQIPT